MINNYLPLRAGVPYRRRDGSRAVLGECRGFLADRERGWLYAHDNPRVFISAEDDSDIVGFYIEPGVWRNRSGVAVKVETPNPNDTNVDYPFAYWSDGYMYTITSYGTYMVGGVPTHERDIVDYISQNVTDDFLSEGKWVTRSNNVVLVSLSGAAYYANGAAFRLGCKGRVRDDYMTLHDLIRPYVEGEEITAKHKTEFMREGYIADGVILKPIPPEWQAFLTRWLDTNVYLLWGEYYTDVLIAHSQNPFVIPYDVTQMYLHTRYVDQIGQSYSVRPWHVKRNIIVERGLPTVTDTGRTIGYELQYTELDDKVVATIVPSHFIHGGAYHAKVTPSWHNPPNMSHNQTHQTYNPLTNMYAEMERVVDRKIYDGDYKSVPAGFKVRSGTGVHMSTQTPGLLAYFPTLRHWQRRVPQQIKPGRYLRQYFPDMHDDDVRRMAGLCSPGDLKFYSRWQDMLKVYQQLADDGVVSSCMSYDKWGEMHPLMVYDNSDVELAVLYIGDKPVARALYNKHNKHFPMTYGQWEKMEQALYRAGFTHASLCGARIRKLPRYVNINRDEIDLDTVWGQARGDAILMPYIDHERALDRSHNCSTNVYLAGDHVVISYDDGEYSADNHENASLSGAQEQCDYCGAYVDEDELRYVEDRDIHVCSHCYNHNTVRVYTSRNIYFATMEDNADQDYVYLSAPDVYVRDSDAAADWGHVWSDWAEDYLDRDDAVWVDSEDDWYPDSQIGKSIMWDGEQSVYMLKEDYEALMAEREEEAEDEAQDEAA